MITYGFYNSLDNDRVYDAVQLSSMFDGIVTDGIFPNIGTAMVVTASGTNMVLSVGIGRAWFRRTWTLNDAILPLTVPAAELVLSRKDAVVLEIDTRVDYRMNSIKIIKGTPNVSPVNPTLINNTETLQIPLAYITVAPNVTVITSDNVDSRVGQTNCPYAIVLDSKLTFDKVFVGTNKRGSIGLSSPNLNVTPVKSGFYYCGSPTNQPLGVGNGYLLHQQYDLADNICTQKYTVFNTGRIFNRENVNGVWTPWIEEYNYNSNSSTAILNPLSYQYPGTFRMTNATADLPPGITSGNNDLWIKVDGIAESVLWRKHTLVDIRSNRVWTRTLVNGVFDAYWTEEFGQAVSDVGSSNLNNWITTKKIYGSNFTNAPLGDTGYFYVDIDGYSDPNYARQSATKLSGTSLGKKYERVKNAGSWFEWNEIPRIARGTSTLKTILGAGSGEWQTPSGNADYPYFAYCTVVGAVVTSSDTVNISGATLNDFALGAACGIADFTITSAGVNTVTVYTQSLPTSNINIVCEVIKG